MFCFYKFAGLLRWREPELLEGDKPLELIPFKIKELNLNKCLVVLDPVIEQLGLSTSLTNSLIKNDIEYVIFNKIEPNPKIRDIELGVKLYQESFCDSIIAFGGGSTMDTAKAIGARIARPNKSITQMGGLLKVGKNIPTLFAIPTTAGTGSETTIASVVTDEVTHHKYAINDLHLIPKYAVLDPTLTVGLPKSITAFTGMDALTHAVEGYISKSVPKKYRLLAEEAIIKIFNNIIQIHVGIDGIIVVHFNLDFSGCKVVDNFTLRQIANVAYIGIRNFDCVTCIIQQLIMFKASKQGNIRP